MIAFSRMVSLKFNALGKIYQVFDRTAAGFKMVCSEGCDDCCTCNVTATGLEIAFLFSRLDTSFVAALKNRLDNAGAGKRYRPQMTTNEFAGATLSGQAVEDEENDPSWGRCPMLEKGRCTIYEYRPFGCRSMLSEKRCRDLGWGQMPPLLLTVSTIFLQYIEHLDAQGISGNFLDLAGQYVSLEEPENFFYEKNGDSTQINGFIRNRRIPALMVPPEHRSQVASLVRELNSFILTDTSSGKPDK